MKIISKKTISKKILIITSGIILAVLLASVWFTHHYQIWPFLPRADSVQQSQNTQNNSDTTNTHTKEGTINNSTSTDASKSTSDIPVSTNVSVQITQLSQDSQNVTYSAQITNPGANGTCSAVFSNSISKPVTLVTAAEGGKCGPALLPNELFASLGKWLLTLRYYTSDTQAIATGTIEVK